MCECDPPDTAGSAGQDHISNSAARWRVIANSAGFYGVDGIAQNAADTHCIRYGHSPAVVDAVPVGAVARCTGCGRSIALLREERNGT